MFERFAPVWRSLPGHLFPSCDSRGIVLPAAVASGLAWVLAATVVALAIAGLLGQLRGVRAPAPGR